MFYKLVFILSILPSVLQAETILSPDEFQAYAEGKTLYFSQQGKPYGAEQYLRGRKSIWQYGDGTCARGIWFPRKSEICFLYEGDTDEQCWHFLRKKTGYGARAIGREPAADLDVTWRNERPISCTGPDVGT